MHILLFGISNVGKSLSGRLLAEHLGCTFYDLDDEVKKDQNTTLEKFVSTGKLRERDAVRCRILNDLVSRNEHAVVAATPLSYTGDIEHLYSSPDAFCIELTDSAENIFGRLVFSDENDVVYKDDAYKNKRRQHYMKEIRADQDWYGSIYSGIKNKFDTSGMLPEEAVLKLINKFHLNKYREA